MNIANNKTYIKIISFASVFVLIVVFLSNTLFSPQAAQLVDESITSKYSYLSEPENSLQIVAIGNSDLTAGVVPNVIWESCGYTSCLISAPRQTPQVSYKKLKKVLENQKPQLVIIETDMLYEDSLTTSGVGVSGKMSRLFEFLDYNGVENAVEDNFTVFRFHDIWKKTLSDDKSTTNISLYTHGYKYNTDVRDGYFGGFMTPNDNSEELRKTDIDYMHRLVKLCRKNNIDVFFIEIISTYSWNYERHNAVNQLAQELDVEFLDTNILVDEIGFDLHKDFRDVGNHLNYTGAVKLTDYLCKYINSRYRLEDLRGNEEYAYWQDACDEFKKLSNIY